MPISFVCHHCDARVTAPSGAAGKKLACPKCKIVIHVPGGFQAPPTLERASPRGRQIAKLEKDDGIIDWEPPKEPNSAAMPLGVCSMVIGLVALLSSTIPCVGHVVAVPLGGIGLCLGTVAIALAWDTRGQAKGASIAGIAVNLAALLLSLVWYLVVSEAINSLLSKKPAIQRPEFRK